jgi:hypothetical protein
MKDINRLRLEDKEIVEFSYHTSWKIILEVMTGNIVKSEVDARMYVVVCNTEKHVPYAKAVGTRNVRHSRDVALTEVVITVFICTTFEPFLLTW